MIRRRRIRALLLTALIATFVGHEAALARIDVTNIAGGGEVFRYPLVLLDGTYDGDRLLLETKPRSLEARSGDASLHYTIGSTRSLAS
jgi:hypothetical protein